MPRGRPKGIKVNEQLKEEELEVRSTADSVAATAVADPVEKKEVPSAPVSELPKQDEPLKIESFETEQGIKLIAFPQIRVGVCEFHGTPHGNVDLNTLKGRCRHDCKTDPYCPHSRNGCDYRDILEEDKENLTMVKVGKETRCRHDHNYLGLAIRCSYCPQNADRRGVIKSRVLYVFMNPQQPGRLIIVCSDYRCQDKFQKQYVRRNIS